MSKSEKTNRYDSNKNIQQKTDGFKTLNVFLIIIIFFLLVVLISGSVVGLKNRKAAQHLEENNDIETISQNTEYDSYKGLGQLRIITAPETDDGSDFGTAMVISPWFTYPQEDKVLFEELSKKRLKLIESVNKYFSDKTKTELNAMSEEKIKADLLEELNSQLSLGKITDIYFSDYIFLE